MEVVLRGYPTDLHYDFHIKMREMDSFHYWNVSKYIIEILTYISMSRILTGLRESEKKDFIEIIDEEKRERNENQIFL